MRILSVSLIAALAATTLLVHGCDGPEEQARQIVDTPRCVWSGRYGQCFCVAHWSNRDYMTWAPPEVCRDAG